MINLWLDDMRPAPEGERWIHVKTDQEARPYFEQGEVERCSLDHDLGACAECMKGMCAEEWLEKTKYQSMPHCEHFGTGYTLICWIEENDYWPKLEPSVHSMNPVGRQKMLAAIKKHYK